MAFFTSAIYTLQTLVTALGAGLGVWGVINLLEGYGNDNPGAMLMVNKEAKQHFKTKRPSAHYSEILRKDLSALTINQS